MLLRLKNAAATKGPSSHAKPISLKFWLRIMLWTSSKTSLMLFVSVAVVKWKKRSRGGRFTLNSSWKATEGVALRRGVGGGLMSVASWKGHNHYCSGNSSG